MVRNRWSFGALALLMLAACGGSKIHAGSRPALLLDQVNSIGADVNAGSKFVYGVVLLRSTVDSPVTIKKVVFTQPEGLGDVVKPLEMDVAHLAPKDDWPVRNWRSFPPTARIGGKCQSMQLEPAAGAVIPPHQAARLIVLFQAAAKGDYYLGGQDVSYTTGDGTTGSIVLPNRLLGTVSGSDGTLVPTGIELACKDLGNVLPG